MPLHQTAGYATPLFVDDTWTEDIDGDAFDPIVTLHDIDHVHPTEMTEEHAAALYAKNGFLVRPNADGDLYVITWRQLHNYPGIRSNSTLAEKQAAIALIEPRKINGKDGQWVECSVVKVFGTDGDGTPHYVSEATEIQVGIIL